MATKQNPFESEKSRQAVDIYRRLKGKKKVDREEFRKLWRQAVKEAKFEGKQKKLSERPDYKEHIAKKKVAISLYKEKRAVLNKANGKKANAPLDRKTYQSIMIESNAEAGFLTAKKKAAAKRKAKAKPKKKAKAKAKKTEKKSKPKQKIIKGYFVIGGQKSEIVKIKVEA